MKNILSGSDIQELLLFLSMKSIIENVHLLGLNLNNDKDFCISLIRRIFNEIQKGRQFVPC